ncbi:hypothetical protein [Streptomyces sp. SYSU K217416]
MPTDHQLVEKRDRDIETGMALLRAALSHPDRTPDAAVADIRAQAGDRLRPWGWRRPRTPRN